MTKSNLERLRELMEGETVTQTDHVTGKSYTTITSYSNHFTIPCLQSAIRDKITNLKNDLNSVIRFFLWVPGIASEENKRDKLNALIELHNKINPAKPLANTVAANDADKIRDISLLNEDVLDGETLELFKHAKNIYGKDYIRNTNIRIFSDREMQKLSRPDPYPRMSPLRSLSKLC